MKKGNWKVLLLIIVSAFFIVNIGLLLLELIVKIGNVGIVNVLLTGVVTYLLLHFVDAGQLTQRSSSHKE